MKEKRKIKQLKRETKENKNQQIEARKRVTDIRNTNKRNTQSIKKEELNKKGSANHKIKSRTR